jgi:hypothetical protein
MSESQKNYLYKKINLKGFHDLRYLNISYGIFIPVNVPDHLQSVALLGGRSVLYKISGNDMKFEAKGLDWLDVDDRDNNDDDEEHEDDDD